MLDIAARYHYIQFQGQLTNQTQENGKKTNFGPDLGSFDPNFPPPPKKNFFLEGGLPILNDRYCRKLSLYAISKKSNDPNSGKW